jgi:hypothetical protein
LRAVVTSLDLVVWVSHIRLPFLGLPGLRQGRVVSEFKLHPGQV